MGQLGQRARANKWAVLVLAAHRVDVDMLARPNLAETVLFQELQVALLACRNQVAVDPHCARAPRGLGEACWWRPAECTVRWAVGQVAPRKAWFRVHILIEAVLFPDPQAPMSVELQPAWTATG